MYRVYIKFLLGTVFVLALIFLGFYYTSPSFNAQIKTQISSQFHFLKNIFSAPKPEKIPTPLVTERFEEGKHYQKLSAKITTSPVVQQFIEKNPGKIQVIEFFGYACFWCQRLHPHLNEWAAKKPENIIFYRFPVYFSKGWDVLAKAYYIVEKIGKNSTLDKEFFLAIHKDHIDLSNEKKLEDFFLKQGISQKQVKELYHSFEVNRNYERGNEVANAYEIIVSPAVVLNLSSGSYLVTAVMAGSEQSVIDIIAFLIDRDLKAASSSVAVEGK